MRESRAWVYKCPFGDRCKSLIRFVMRMAGAAALILVSPAPVAAPLTLSQVNSDNGLPARSVQWTDSSGQARTAIMVDQRQGGAGYLRRLTYRINGVNRVCTGTGDNGHQGDGYVQNHTAFGGDSSSHGVPGTTTVPLAGAHHVIISYHMPSYSISGQNVPTTVQWFFADGRSHPIFALSQDARATGGNIGADSRSPYGDMAYDGGAGVPVGGASFGDTYKFTTLAANPERVTRNTGWRYNEANTIPYAMQWSDPAQVDAEMGHVATVPITVQDAGSDPRTFPVVDLRGTEDLNGPMINDENWAYQILNYVLPADGSPTWSKRLTWGTQWGLPGGFDNYGNAALNVRQFSKHSNSQNGAFNSSRADGMLMAYSVFVVFGPHAGGYKDGTVGQMVKQMENFAAATLSAVIGNVKTSGPYGIGNAANATVNYSPAGYNPIFATWELTAAGNAVEGTLSPAAGRALDHPIFVVNGYTAAQLPASISVGDGLATPEIDYFATHDAANQKLWITVNRSSATPITLKIGGGVVQPQAPVINAIPASGEVGSSVVITGANLNGASAVRFNGLNASFNVDSPTQITAVVPSGATVGPISVQTPGGTATSAANFTPLAAPVQETTPIYSDQLHNADNWSWATVDMANAAPVHSGARSIKVTAGGYEAMRVHFNAPISPASYTALSFWLHGGTAGGQPLLIQATVNDQAQAGVALGSPPANSWQKYTVTLAELGLNGKPTFDGFWIQNNSAQAISAFYVDDIDLVGAAPQPIPAIAGITPSSGLVGSSVVITGQNFDGATSVRFNGVAATFTLNSPTQITAVVPAGATAGPISVTTGNGTATSAMIFTPTAPPVEQTLAIYTDQLHNADNWSWATVDMANATPVHSGARSIKVTAGAYEAVRVHFNAPISPAPYTALSFWLHGGTTGGQPLLLQATVNDQALAGLPLAAPPANAWQKYTINLAALGVAGRPNFDGFWIQNNSGQAISAFYVDDIDLVGSATPPQPTISSIAPSTAAAGASVTITGSNFSGVTEVKFNGIIGVGATFTVNSTTQITATVPAGATAGPITVVTGNGTATSPMNFTPIVVPPVPTITAITPASGAVGETITISGTGFSGASEVKFNGVSASFTVNSSTELTALVPAGATTGQITVTTPGGTATSGTFTVTIPEPEQGGFKQMDTDDGGWFTGFAIHSAGRLYGRTDVGGLYRSDDNGDSWRYLSGNMTTYSALVVQGVAVASNADVVYQCVGVSYAPPADQGIWKSTDAGATWRLVKGGIRFSGNDAERWGGECIAIRPGNDNEVWAGTRGDGLWRSTDAGQTWTQSGSFAGAQFASISLPPTGRSDIWVGASGFAGPGGVWVSVNDGATWTLMAGSQNGVAAPGGVWRIVREPNGKVLVSGGNGGGTVLYEFDAANWNNPGTYTWSDIAWPGIDRAEAAPLVAALADGRIVAGSIFGGYNGGPNSLRTQVRSLAGAWSPIDALNGTMPAWQRSSAPTLIEGGRNALVQDPSNPSRWFMAGGYGPFRTTDNGTTWQYIVNGIDEVVAYKVNFHPTDANRVYLPMADHAGAVVLDGGNSGTVSRYISTPKNYPDDLALAHAILASGDRLLALGGDERARAGENDAYRPRIFRSLNNGQTWSLMSPVGLPNEPKRCIISAVASRDNGDDILLAVAGTDNGANGGVYRSTDGGNTFVRTAGLPVGADYGDQFTWNADLDVDASDNNVRYLFLKNRGLYKSTNRGANWALVNTGLPTYGVVAADRSMGNRLWVGTCCGQPIALSRSTDGGANWTTVAGFTSVIDVDAAGDRVAVLGQRTGDTFNKIYYSGDAGGAWTEITRAGYRFSNAHEVAVDPWRPGTIWISTNGRSVARYTPGDGNVQTVSVTVNTIPPGQSYIVDGVTYTGAQTFNWVAGSAHQLGATSPQESGVDTRLAWKSWSDGGAISHEVTPTVDTTYTVNFATEYLLRTVANPADSATITANPAGPWYADGETVFLKAFPKAGFSVSGWSNAESGEANTARVYMFAPQTVTANLVSDTVPFTVTTVPAGLRVNIDGASFTAPMTFNWVPGSVHRIETAAVQFSPDLQTRYVLSGWGDTTPAATIEVTVSTTPMTFSATFTTQHFLETVVSPVGTATITTSPDGPWYYVGQVVQLTAVPRDGYTISNWSAVDDRNGQTAQVTMSGPKTVTLTLAAAPATLTIEQPRISAAGEYQFAFNGRSDRTYRVEATENFTNWTLVQTYNNPVGPINFSDNTFRTFEKRFYRVVEVTP